MKKNALMMVLPALFALGCDDSGTKITTDMTATPDMAMAAGDMAMAPAAPTLGAQIDRMGRPGINTAAVNPFDLKLTHMPEDAAKDAYNADSDPTKWVANWTKDIAVNLAVYDGADTVCGNQLAAGAMPIAGRYDMLASILADDRLWVNSAQTTCSVYLGVEAAALGLPIMDCGGRTLSEDVIDETYTALTVGVGGFMANGSFAVTDNVPKDNDGVASATFPFLGAPN